MRKFTLMFMVTILVGFYVAIEDAYAYSYGDPNEEKVAEAYKEMLIKLNQTPPDYHSAKQIYDTVKEEIDMHMGTEPSEAVMKHIENEDKAAVISDMEKILALNISRRLENVDQNFQEYDTSKKLLAKAFATYNALKPVIGEINPDANQKLEDSFQSALEAIGNPGLFGVGEIEPNYDQFVSSKEEILNTLKDLFKMPSLEVGHFTEEDFEASEQYNNAGWTDLTSLKNWLPILILVGAILFVFIYVTRKKKLRR